MKRQLHMRRNMARTYRPLYNVWRRYSPWAFVERELPNLKVGEAVSPDDEAGRGVRNMLGMPIVAVFEALYVVFSEVAAGLHLD